MTDEPIRLLDPASDAGDRLRAALQAGRDEAPTRAQIDSLAARLGPLFGGPGGGGSGAPPSTAITALKGLAAAAAIAIVSGAIWLGVRSTSPGPQAAVDAGVVQRDAQVDLPMPEEMPRGLDPPVLADAGRGARPPRARVDAGAEAAQEPVPPAPDVGAELRLIRESQDALRAREFDRALAAAQEHRRRFPTGTLAEEAAVLEIDAIAHLGRAAEARELARAFHERWPRSASGRRVDVIVAQPQ